MRYTIDDICEMPEGQTFDRKSVHIAPKALANTIVAMANADGGMIAIGIPIQHVVSREWIKIGYILMRYYAHRLISVFLRLQYPLNICLA